MDDILLMLSNAKVFSKLDLCSAYWHVHLDEEFSLLTIFQTPLGRYRWKRLPFGTSVSSELFQKRLSAVLEYLERVIGVSDDESATEDHNKNLIALLNRCRSVGMKLNRDKAKIRKSKVTFLGHKVTSEGLKIDPEKVDAILQMQMP